MTFVCTGMVTVSVGACLVLLPSPLEPAPRLLFLQSLMLCMLPVNDFKPEALDKSVSKPFTKTFVLPLLSHTSRSFFLPCGRVSEDGVSFGPRRVSLS